MTFGEYNHLFGILSEPQNESSDAYKPIVLILNSGLVNRAGPFRMSAELARVLTSSGYEVFRFDLSGIGDSERPNTDRRGFEERNLDDIEKAVCCLRKRNPSQKVIVLGLCTGADFSHRAGSRISSVSGCILLDGYGYPSMRFYLKRFVPILLNPIRFFKAAAMVFKALAKPETSNDDSGFTWEHPLKSEYIENMETMHKRNVKHLYVHTGGVKSYFNYANQYKDVFSKYPFSKDVTTEYFENADHSYILLKQRKQLFSLITDWLSTEF